MGLLSWWSGSEKKNPQACGSSGMNGAEKVRRPDPSLDLSLIEFGKSENDEVLAGYCPVSDKIEPCDWQLLSVKNRVNKPA
ncbi:hypothetical protein C2S51_005906, partial [Perilla frutescens var. frutescens]